MAAEPTYTSKCGTIRLWLGDCLSILPELEADACVFDPPYGIAHQTNHGASWERTQIAGDKDTSTRDAILAWCNGRIPWACFGSWKVATPEQSRGVLVWDKGPAFGMGDLSFPWKSSWEEIAIGGPGWTGTRDEGVLRGHIVVSWESKGRQHPHQKPVSLLESLLNKLPHVRVVADPTCGTGSTAIACIHLGKEFRGCEIDPKHFETAVRRIEAELRQPRLFPTPEPAPQQTELFAQ